MPQVKHKIPDSWYENVAVDAKGRPRQLSLGAALSFKPGQKRFIKGSFIVQARSTFDAFKKAFDNKNLKRCDEPKKMSAAQQKADREAKLAEEAKAAEDAEPGEGTPAEPGEGESIDLPPTEPGIPPTEEPPAPPIEEVKTEEPPAPPAEEEPRAEEPVESSKSKKSRRGRKG